MLTKHCNVCGTIIPYGGKTDLCAACRTERNRERMRERSLALNAAAKANHLCEMCGAPTNGIRGYLCAECRQRQTQNGEKNEGEAICPSLLLCKSAAGFGYYRMAAASFLTSASPYW